MSEFVEDEVGDGFGDAGLLKGRSSERTVNLRLRQLQNAAPKEFEEEEIHLLRVRILLLGVGGGGEVEKAVQE